jgi:hypothetical protein
MSLVPVQNPHKTHPRRASATMTHNAYAFPAPNNGIDVSQPLPGGDPTKAIRLDNLIPRVFGCVLREGYRNWVMNLGGEVRTLMSYQPAHNADGAHFAASDNGKVYDVTAPQSSTFVPTPVWSVPPLDMGRPGQFSYTNFTTGGDVHFLCVVGQGAGYRTWNGTAWEEHAEGTDPGEIEGIDPKKFDFVMQWKRRLWFIEANSTIAWYLPVDVIAGKATPFDFGPLLPHGGSLAMLQNWTVDGGEGLDDNLIIISTQGDVLLYKGTDPDEATTFSMVGRWYVGRVPVGRRFSTHYSTDLAILSERGLVFLSELLRGQAFFDNAIIARNVNGELGEAVIKLVDYFYWELKFLPREQMIIINAPRTAFGDMQWAFEINSKAFCNLYGMPMLAVDTFNSRTFFGDDSGSVWRGFDGDSDGKIDDVEGRDLEGGVLTTFQPVSDGVRLKRFLMVRPSFTAPVAPAITAKINGNWNFSMPSYIGPFTGQGMSEWDISKWDECVWNGEAQSYESWYGANGTGRFAALAMKVKGYAGTTFIGWSILVENGGIL